MAQKTNQPKFKILNEQRTQGEWEIKDRMIGRIGISVNANIPDKCEDIFAAYGNSDDKEVKANSAYTALAVNNLHHLAEALIELDKFLYIKYGYNDLIKQDPSLYKKVKQALARIS